MRKAPVILILLIAIVVSGCSKNKPETVTPPPTEAGTVAVRLKNPVIAGQDSYATPSKAWTGNGETPRAMERGRTIRLYIFNSPGDPAQANPYPPELYKLTSYTFRVTGEGDTPEVKAKGAVLCNVDPATGNWTTDVTDSDLHLPVGKYDFFAISPAVELENRNVTFPSTRFVPSKQIQHGGLKVKDRLNRDSLVTLLTTPPKFGVEVSGGPNGVCNVEFGLFSLLTSRVRFIVKRGDIDDIAMHANGILMTGLSQEAYRPNFALGELELDPMNQTGVTGGQTRITDFEKIYDNPTDPDDYHYELLAELLPSPPGMSSDVDLTLNFYVNGTNYKEYTYTLDDQSYRRGYSYTYQVTVNASGLFVRGWTDIGWTATIPR